MNEAELVFSEILGCNRASLYLDRDRILGRKASSFISAVLKRRISAEPVQYILGKTEFMGLEFKVNTAVFIPRPETEVLVESVIKLVHSPQCPAVHSILDIGTGSGCIAVSLAKLLPNVKIIATDISQRAIEIAQYNALLHNVIKKVKFIQADLFPQTANRKPQTDIIISNPPYIAAEEIKTLQPEIQYEPRIALDGGKDGLDFYRRIINEAPLYLKTGGFLILEIGFSQKQAVKNIFQTAGNFEIIEVVKDYQSIDRVIVARLK